jgi:hypothetical protein
MTPKESTTMRHLVLLTVVATLALGGCGATPLEADYGNSVRQMNENQVYDRATLLRPSVVAPEGADPDMLSLAIKTMRTEATERKQVSQPLVISIGGQGGQ